MPYHEYLTPEDHVHISVITYLRAVYPKVVWFHPPQEGKRTRFEQWKAKMLGLTSGIPDLIILHDRKHLAIELKAGKNKATDKQKEWLLKLQNNGWETAVCTGFEEAKTVIDKFLK